MGVKVAIGSRGFAISKVTISNGHCISNSHPHPPASAEYSPSMDESESLYNSI